MMEVELKVLYEDNHLIALNKDPGMIVQADKTGDKPMSEMVADYIAKKYEKPGRAFIGVVHRIDRPVSGVILFARTSKALDRMNKQFKEREIEKTYWAVIRNPPPKTEDTLVHWLTKDGDANKVSYSLEETPGSLRSELSYRLMAEENGFFLLEVKPITGRSHQIRVQLSSMGCPICGDNKYGYPRGYKEKFIALHARKLEFIHPIKKENILIKAPIPDNLGIWEYWKGME
jgi:23S rRNA pseudouridine1911/1915/1917 synthase